MSSEHPRLRIAFLGESSDAPILNPREAQSRPRAESLGALVESRRQPEGVMEQSPEHVEWELGRVIDSTEGTLTGSALAERGEAPQC